MYSLLTWFSSCLANAQIQHNANLFILNGDYQKGTDLWGYLSHKTKTIKSYINTETQLSTYDIAKLINCFSTNSTKHIKNTII